jgi:hypothetical protein
MMTKFVRFNLNLCLALTFIFATACHSTPEEKKKKKEAKEVAYLDLHLEVNRDGSTDNEEVTINRSSPYTINVDKMPFVSSGDIDEAVIVDDFGGFVIRVKFDWRGTQLLDGVTSANHNKRIAVFARFPDSRWIASPVIRKRIGDGVLAFTPDCSREEAERIVRGLNNVAKKAKEADKW